MLVNLDQAALIQLKDELTAALAEAEAALEAARAMDVSTEPNAALARELADECTSLIKAREDQRKSVTQPVNEFLSQINAVFKPITGTLAECKRVINTKLFEEKLKAEQAREGALRKLAVTGPEAAKTVIIPAQRKPVELPKGVGREVIEVEILDPAQVPRGFCSPDVRLIKDEAKLARKRGHMLTVPGCRIYLRGSGT